MKSPLAIVGVGCRLPGGVASLADLEALLAEGRSGIVDVPAERWDKDALYHPDFRKRGHLQATRGGFLSEVAAFDPGFFGIAPKEALRMDPQQRLVLETSYEAVADAGIPLAELAGSRTACYVGCGSHDYGTIQTERVQIGPTSNTGVAGSIVSNRVSFLFDLRGPSATVDTACSSALTALHLACGAIWAGSAEAALAGGVNLILRPESSIGFSKGGYLSPDGECRAFSDDANGYVRSEGAGVVLILPLEEAERRGLRVHGVILSTVLNQDGRTPGMTMPSRAAQEAMLREAYAQAGVTPDEVVYVEAHGTGTAIGDPIEAGAIGSVLGAPRQGEAPLYLGSIKTNVGHLETGAGVAGLLKLILVLSRRRLYPNRHFRAPNPEIPFDELRLAVPTEVQPLPAAGRLVGGVNSFGFGGTNGHLVLASPGEPRRGADPGPPAQQRQPSRAASSRELCPLWLSARSEPALRQSAADLADWLQARPALPLAELAAGLTQQRSAFPFRLALAGTREPLLAALRAFAAGEPGPAEQARVPDGEEPQPVVVVFSGQGPQWFAMGRELLAQEPRFAARLAEVEAELARLGWLPGSSLGAELARDEASSRIGETEVAQPALYALQLGLLALLEAHQVEVAAALGHSIGELAAAVCAGALSWQEGCRIVLCRSRAQSLAEGAGAMAALGLSPSEVAPHLAALRDQGHALDLAAVNGPSAITLAGPHAAVEALGARLEAGTFFRRLEVSVPFHCALMDPCEAPFREALGEVERGATRLPFVSTVTGAPLAGEELDADYWWRNIRAPVRFFPAVEALLAQGHTRFLEVGPHPVLRRGLREGLRGRGTPGHVIPTLVRGEPELEALALALGRLFLANVPCRPLRSELRASILDLPPYPFQRRRYWLETPQAALLRRRGVAHPTLGWPERSAVSPRRFSASLRVDPVEERYLDDHKVQGLIVLPGAGQLEACHSAGVLAWGSADHWLEDVVLRLPISLPPEGDPPEFRFEVYSDEGHFEIASRPPGEADAWTLHTRGRINPIDPFPAVELDLAELRALEWTPMEPARFYAGMAETGLVLGEAFQGVVELYVRPESGEVLSKVVPPASLEQELSRFAFHPALLDAVFQGSSLASFRQARHGLFLPHRAGKMKFYRRPEGEPLWVYARLVRPGEGEVTLDLFALDEQGQKLMELQGFVLKLVAGSALARESLRERPYYRLTWEAAPEPARGADAPAPRGTWVVLDEGGPVGAALRARLREAGARALAWGPDELAPGEEEAALAALGEEPCAGLIHLWSLAPAAHDPEQALLRGPAALAAWVGALGRRGAWDFAAGRPSVLCVTADTWGEVGDEPVSGSLAPWGAPLWGAARVLRNEDPRLLTTSVDLSASAPDAAELEALCALLGAADAPTELRLRGGARELGRLYAVDRDATKRVGAQERPYRAAMLQVGVLDSAALVERRRRAPGPGQVEVAVEAAAINFKDVVVGMGLLDRGAWEGGTSRAELGMDLAGRVLRVGEGVRDLAEGDEVLGLASGSLSSHVLVDRLDLIPRPPALTPALAASLPTVFLTADLALRHLARVEPGEVVLIHAAAGGVGTAAVQIAHELGARVIGTTSSQRKRDYLAELGVTTVFDSRSPHFREQVLEATGGRGVDVVLNSLSGDALRQGIRCLASFGRFVEIGKLDLVKNGQLGMEPFLRNLSYHCLDTNRWVAARKRDANERMIRLAHKVAEGAYRMPVETFPIAETSAALKHLAAAKHVGKVSISLPREGRLTLHPGERELFRRDGAYLVTGGCAGFGLEVADWIARQGAGALLLLNRSGVQPAQAERIAAIEARGARVLAPATDVGDPAALAAALDLARAELPPLRGVFHAAMVLDDAPLSELTPERFARVGHPKVRGGWNLHRATLADPLDHFLVFSSIAAVLGTPGQANYAAANAFLAGLVRARRRAGRVGSALDLGIVDGAGVVARASAERRERILGQGVDAFDVARALEVLGETLRVEPVERLAAIVDWERLTLPPEGRETLFSPLIRGQVRSTEGQSLLDQLREVEPDQRAERIVAWVGEFLAGISGQEASSIDAGASLSRLGIDSLMANQLLAWLQSSFEVEVPLVRLMQGPTVRELAEEVAQRALAAPGSNGSQPE